MGDSASRRKLIEVSIPLEAINAAAAREKSIRHGHPSTLHLWWARRPLAACRAVLFAQLVDDPSSWPDRFPTLQMQAMERDRLNGIIERLVPWESSRDDAILDEARWEIARSVAWGRGDEPPPRSDPAAVRAYLLHHAPPVYDPFCGGGSIPLEAQRLGLRAIGSDLNPVAVLISKALLEIPPRFAGKPPVSPRASSDPDLLAGGWRRMHGLAADVRYYGTWMREQAAERIGHLYPKAVLPNGTEATVVAWLWARTVRSPDPMARSAHVPLVSSFMLSDKRRVQAWVEPIVDFATSSYRFQTRTGTLAAAERARLKRGTKSARGYFACILTGAPISYEYVDAEANAGRMSVRLMAIVAEARNARTYLDPTEEHEKAARSAEPHWRPEQPCRGTFASNAQGRLYGFKNFGDYFTPRQLTALGIFADLVGEARQKILADEQQADRRDPGYADAVATYLAFALSKLADRGSSICTWFTERDSTRPTFARQAIPMTWDFAELNTLHTGTGSFEGAVAWTAESLEHLPDRAPAAVVRRGDAREHAVTPCPAVISTDPPYYDNISYGDLSDFFYVWLRRSLVSRDGRASPWPDLLAAPLTPKDAELVASPYRHGGKTGAETFFIGGMSKAVSAMRRASDPTVPITIYYAFKQSESVKDGTASPGWASFLQAVADSGLAIAGTWPLRTELNNRMIGIGTNALASSIVLVCKVRPPTASIIEREAFVRALRRELPPALAAMRAAGIGPVDLAQSVIGPGMGVFTRHAAVIEHSGRNMTVRTALALINQVLDDIGADDDTAYDLPSRFALDWFQETGWDARPSGEAILAANARNLAITQLVRGGMIATEGGRTRLIRREELPRRGPAFMRPPTTWQAAQLLARALTSENGGIETAAAVMARIAERESVRAMAYRLYGLCDRRGWSAEALVWNRLAEEWRTIAERAGHAARRVTHDLFELRA